MQQVRTALEQWIQTRDTISREKRDFELTRQVLGDRIDLLTREIQSLRDKDAAAKTSIAAADNKRADLLVQNQALQAAADTLSDTITRLERRTTALIARLPDPLGQHIKPLARRLPSDPNSTKQTLSERFQNVVGILNAVDKFNRDIHVTSEVRTLEDGRSIEAAAMYIGIAQGYYVSADGTIASVGTVGPERWQWQRCDTAAPQIADAIAMWKNEKAAGFVALPVVVQ